MKQRSPWVILSFLCIPVFIGAVDLTIVSAILPEVIVSLGLPPDSRLDDAFWAITGYLLAYTVSMVFVGRLSDIVGRRGVYILCLLIFMFGSYFVAVAHTWPTDLYLRVFREISPDKLPPEAGLRTLYMIILGRVIQAIGAGALTPVTMAMVSDLFPRDHRAQPIGLVGAIDTVGWMLGHLYGGVMVKFLGENASRIQDFFGNFGVNVGIPDWRLLFHLNVVAGVLTLLAMVVMMRGLPQKRLKEPFDWLGTVLLAAALIGLNVGLGNTNPEAPTDASAFQQAAEEGMGMAAPLLVGAAIAFLLFLLVESRLRYPLVNLRLFLQRNVYTASITNVGVGFCLTIGLVIIPILVNIREASTESDSLRDAALLTGLLLSGLTVPMALTALPGAWLSDRYGYRVTITSGMLLSALGFLIAGLTWQGDMSYWVMFGQIAVVGLGLGITISPVAAAFINAANPAERGSASSLVLALRLVGMTLALSSLSTFAINRVNRLVGERSAGILNTDVLYIDASYDVAKELMLLGAFISLIAALVSLWMHGGSAAELALEPENERIEPTPTPDIKEMTPLPAG